MEGRIHFTVPLPSNDRWDTDTDIHTDGGMKYAVEMDSGAIIHITSFIMIGSGIQKLIRWDRHTYSLLFIFSKYGS
jgi:hypothetical protein